MHVCKDLHMPVFSQIMLTFAAKTKDMSNEININKRAKLEFTARITMEDGTVIEKTVVAEGGVPDSKDIDVHTLDGFRKTFDDYERAALKARNQIGEAITQEYLDEVKKKNVKE